MFLPTSTESYGNRNGTNEYQYQELGGIKRTSTALDTNKLQGYNNNQQGLLSNQQPSQQTYNSQQQNSNNPILNFNGTPRHK